VAAGREERAWQAGRQAGRQALLANASPQHPCHLNLPVELHTATCKVDPDGQATVSEVPTVKRFEGLNVKLKS